MSILEINNKFGQQFINNQTDSSSEDEKPKSPQRQVKSDSEFRYLNIIKKITPQKWHTKVKIIINKKYEIDVIVLVDSGADLNCIQEGLIRTKYFEKSTEQLNSANGSPMKIIQSQ